MATTAGESIFVETNVVVHARNADSPDHAAAKQRLSELQQSGAELWISRQVLREFGVVFSRQMMARDVYDSTALVDEIERLVPFESVPLFRFAGIKTPAASTIRRTQG